MNAIPRDSRLRYRCQLRQGAEERRADTHPLTWRLREDGARVGFEEYREKEGYRGAAYTLERCTPDEVIDTMKRANVRGRGGGGFSAGVKWSLTLVGDQLPRGYLLCNADEMEPGTFKDRLLLEQQPHLLIEGMIIAGYANRSRYGYIFLRGEYVEAARSLALALEEAREAGWLGESVNGSGFDFDIALHTGAGRYICGEETALINSLEGKRANPRTKPPFPGQSGAWGKPTVVNNVETLCNAPGVMQHGAEWYQGLSDGLSEDGGTKLYGVSGLVERPGLWELPIGTRGREILERAGGMREGHTLKTWLPGGGSTGFLLPEHLELPLDFDTVGDHGSRLGTGLLTVVSERQSIVALLRNLEQFFARESCGWCTPCRDGLSWVVKLLQALERGEGEPGDIELLEQHATDLGPGQTFCAHAPGAAMPLESAIRHFRADFEAGIVHSVLEGGS
ncbi:SLBB domain-containing protein [Halomonas sp. KAO]|uniref:NADH-ubiquinone oxidoreductase-F iron-sulfur binding region domain-containing protein n=1 Tax=unclassified Halomonas TaxID=2609666 RepID=UPI00189DB484|nr:MULTISPECIES: NADH-ubiquinone oxidoreductase-F iron-sulfur binding region domain-containing protein [unclassified Halomonas]MBF7053567.1 SLBB domain-containing protein [Halomonas sp. KAO]MDT0500846.1 NADH-ubiquinone oxidoreductase-F iron-sulfur binding region domain-containing protein [Halomonas sp. PAR7]MDT0512582.1 NADH-ubiquinone oxidoreductase-F iron-sulfur binding region domain-containing protein [Halomonas sp. LES1]MDT0592836.1 NADH-ubiquinone oxidoreductase-F iron-sulfur binding regio